jgi:hypothetical protein
MPRETDDLERFRPMRVTGVNLTRTIASVKKSSGIVACRGGPMCPPRGAGDPPVVPIKNCAGLTEIDLQYAERPGLDDEKDWRVFSKPKPRDGCGGEAHQKFFTGNDA